MNEFEGANALFGKVLKPKRTESLDLGLFLHLEHDLNLLDPLWILHDEVGGEQRPRLLHVLFIHVQAARLGDLVSTPHTNTQGE